MANIKSSKKRIITNNARAERNKAFKSEVKTAVKKVLAAVEANDKETASAALVHATSLIQKGATKHIFHKNTAVEKYLVLQMQLTLFNLNLT